MTNGNKLKVGVVGATGYAGAELVRLLLSHPNAEIAAVSSVSFEGKKMSDIYPVAFRRMRYDPYRCRFAYRQGRLHIRRTSARTFLKSLP